MAAYIHVLAKISFHWTDQGAVEVHSQAKKTEKRRKIGPDGQNPAILTKQACYLNRG